MTEPTRRAALETLHLSERRYRTLLEQSPFATQVLAPDGSVIAANAAWERLWDTRREFLQGYNILKDPQLAAKGVLPLLERAFAGESVVIPPVRYDPADIGKPGRARWVKATAYPVTDETGSAVEVVLILEDVTARHEAAEERERLTAELRYQLDRIRTITDHLASCLLQLDARGYPLFVNPAFERVTGYTLEEIQDRPAHYSVHYKYPDGQPYPMEECPIDRAYPIMKPVPYGEEVFVRKDGTLFPVAFSVAPLVRDGRNVGAVVEFRDISAQKEAEAERERLLAAEQAARQQADEAASRLRRVQRVTDAVLSHLDLDELLNVLLDRVQEALGADTAVVLLLEESGEALVVRAARGLEEEQAQSLRVPVGRGFAGTVAAERRPVLLDDIRDGSGAERGGAGAARVEILSPVLRESGVRSLLGVPLDVAGRLTGVLHVGALRPAAFSEDDIDVLRVVAERVATAIDRARLYQQAQAAVHLRDEFLLAAAHELKTPATSLRGMAQVMLRRLARDGGLTPKQVQRALELIDQQTARLATLVEQLLDVSRIAGGYLALERQVTDVAALVRSVVAHVQVQAESRPFVVDIPASRVLADVDSLRLEQAVLNLLDNAIKFSPDESPVEVTLVVERGQARIGVRDRGVGVPPHRRHAIFDRFYQAHAGSHYGGMGLGLYIAKEIVELHGGTIGAEFPQDGGSRFVVTLPLAGAATGHAFPA